MYLIAGLGNPETKYNTTRHNAGFGVIDAISEMTGIRVRDGKFRALTGKGRMGTENVILMKPLTYMNNSGEAIRPAADYYHIDTRKQLIVISDDTELPVGKLRIRAGGSDGGHNGLKSVIHMLGHEDFIRVRVGVGRRPQEYDQIDWVLGHFDKEDIPVMKKSIGKAAEAVACIIDRGVEAAMNDYNGISCNDEK